METDNRIDIIVCFMICAVFAFALIIMEWESNRKTEYLTQQVKEMRQSMEEAGYVSREPRIEAAR